jgi:hypothetical protein
MIFSNQKNKLYSFISFEYGFISAINDDCLASLVDELFHGYNATVLDMVNRI